MKVTIEFDGFEEKEELRNALDGDKWKGVVWEMDQELRKITKYGFIGQREATDQERESAEKFREEIRRLLDEWNLILE
tara:strand:+ start:611 stop:844 length:234 start_codon:yes stop_codon:yes gene_type:complete